MMVIITHISVVRCSECITSDDDYLTHTHVMISLVVINVFILNTYISYHHNIIKFYIHFLYYHTLIDRLIVNYVKAYVKK